MSIKSTVIIPTKERQNELERAINSVLVQSGSKDVKIVVVDDNSKTPIQPSNLRPHDLLIRNSKNLGGAVSRNIGIDNAEGRLIYFLDSDDHFIQRNFEQDHLQLEDGKLYYCDIISNRYKSRYPNMVSARDFVQFVCCKYRFLGQTSSLVYSRKSLSLRFDESLPRHQDWDFCLIQALNNGIPMERTTGQIFFDRSDKSSVSRTVNFKKSDPWLEKLKLMNTLSKSDQDLLEYILYAPDLNRLDWLEFISTSARMFARGQCSPMLFAKQTYKRLQIQ